MANWCNVCEVKFQDETSYQGHILGKKHLRNEEYAKIISRSIFVARIPCRIPSNTLLNFFSEFGTITQFHFNQNSLIVEFQNENPVKVLLEKPIYFGHIRLNIHKRIIRYNKPQAKQSKDEIDLNYENIKSIFEDGQSFDEQLTVFLNKVAIKESDIISQYEPVCKQLEEIFRTIFPKCKMYRFGSTVSGLGFTNCDLDIYMDPGFPICHEDKGNLDRNIISASTVFSEVKKILFARSSVFSKVIPIPKAKTPIIKFCYLPSNISCDISFKNNLAVHNSLLVKHCLSLDPRLQPAMMVIKYWVSNFELRVGKKIPKYSLTMLFLFYLQQESVKLIPPLIELKKKVVPELIEGWQVNFDNNIIVNNDYKESEGMNKSIPELLYGFFVFYAHYEFSTNVICTIDGQSHNKESFNDIDKIPDSMDRYRDYLKTKENPVPFSLTTMCVQDPNELCFNVTANINAKYLKHFQTYCAAAAEICIAASVTGYKQLLPSIFSLKIKIPKSSTKNFSFDIYLKNFITTGLPKNLELNTGIVNKKTVMNTNWYNLMMIIIQRFFEGVLRLQVQLVGNVYEQKQQKAQKQSDVHSNYQDKIILHCTGEYCFWKNRKNELNLFDISTHLLDKEIQLTKKMYKNMSENNQLEKLKIDFHCQIWKQNGNNIHVNVTLLNNNSTNNIFFELATFIKSKLKCIVQKTMLHMKQFKKTSIID